MDGAVRPNDLPFCCTGASETTRQLGKSPTIRGGDQPPPCNGITSEARRSGPLCPQKWLVSLADAPGSTPPHPTGRPDVQGFYGALAGQRARKGGFITTSTYTQQAVEFASSVEGIILIDGVRLTELMMEYGVGVSHRTIRVPKGVATTSKSRRRRGAVPEPTVVNEAQVPNLRRVAQRERMSRSTV